MSDLINRLRETASKGVSVWGDLQMEAAQAIEALQARCVELENLTAAQQASNLKLVAALNEAKPSPTALELMREYSNGKQWAQEHLLSETAIDAAAAVLADGYWQHATPQSKLVYASHARAMIEAALKEGL